MANAIELRTVEDATCTFCGCVCDDMELTVEGNRITKAKNACVLGKAWFLSHTITSKIVRCCTGGRQARDPGRGRRPGRSHPGSGAENIPSSTDCSDTDLRSSSGSRVAIADRIGGCVDTTTSVCHGPTAMAFQSVGEVTCSLGEVKNRADFVMFWGSNPAESHPRHWGRYSTMPKGLSVPNGRKDRTVVVVDVRRSKSAPAADLLFADQAAQDFEALWVLRGLARGAAFDSQVGDEIGIPLAALEDLMQRMKKCKFGVLFFGMGLSMTRGKHLNVEAALALVRDLNDFTRFYAKPMRGHGNVTGADNVVSWQTGYPFGVSLQRGYPRFNPGEFTTVDTLSRGRSRCHWLIVAVRSDGQFPAKLLSRPPGKRNPRMWSSIPRRRRPCARPPSLSRRQRMASIRPAPSIAWTTCRFPCGPHSILLSRVISKSSPCSNGGFASCKALPRAAPHFS